jgi:hypothetical protein
MWDPKSGARERLYLLTRIGSSDPSHYDYRPVSDSWRSSDGRTYRVALEADESLQVLEFRGLSSGAALNLIQCGLAAGVTDTEWIDRHGS